MTASKRVAKPQEGPIKFVGIDRMAQELGDKCTKTVKRLIANDADFPPVVILGNKIHAEQSRWEKYKHILINRGTKVRPFPLKREG